MKTDDAIKHFGSQLDLAKALGLTKQAISLWHKNKVIPRSSAYRLQVMTAGKLQVDESVYVKHEVKK